MQKRQLGKTGQKLTVIGPGHMELLNFACDAVENLSPLSDDELNILTKKTQNITPIFSS